MAYVEVPKDISKVKTKFIGSLTKRQCIGFGLAGSISLPFYYLFSSLGNQDIALIVLIIIAFPLVFITIYEKDGLKAEEILRMWLIFKFVAPLNRKYRINEKNKYLMKGEKLNDKSKTTKE